MMGFLSMIVSQNIFLLLIWSYCLLCHKLLCKYLSSLVQIRIQVFLQIQCSSCFKPKVTSIDLPAVLRCKWAPESLGRLVAVKQILHDQQRLFIFRAPRCRYFLKIFPFEWNTFYAFQRFQRDYKLFLFFPSVFCLSSLSSSRPLRDINGSSSVLFSASYRIVSCTWRL